MSTVQKIVSGGQTGVDRGALDAAMAAAVDHGGYCPAGRRAEDGAIPDHYRLEEMPSRDYSARTEANVVHSDGTLIICRGKPTGGTALTVRLAVRHARPLHIIDIDGGDVAGRVARALDWIEAESIAVLNVAGPRESGSPGIGEAARRLVTELLAGAQSKGAR